MMEQIINVCEPFFQMQFLDEHTGALTTDLDKIKVNIDESGFTNFVFALLEMRKSDEDFRVEGHTMSILFGLTMAISAAQISHAEERYAWLAGVYKEVVLGLLSCDPKATIIAHANVTAYAKAVFRLPCPTEEIFDEVALKFFDEVAQ